MQIRISDELNTILLYARDEAMRTGSYVICADHLMLGILRHADNAACRLLLSLGIDLDRFKRYIDGCLFRDRSVPYDAQEQVGVGRSALNVINMAAFEALQDGSDQVQALHLLLSLSRTAETACASYLAVQGAGTRELSAQLEALGWRHSVESAPLPPQEDAAEEVRRTVESQVQSLVFITPSGAAGGKLPS